MSRRHGEPVWILEAQQHVNSDLPEILKCDNIPPGDQTAWWKWESAEDPLCVRDVIQPPNQQIMKPVSRCYDSSQNLSIIPERNVIYFFF